MQLNPYIEQTSNTGRKFKVIGLDRITLQRYAVHLKYLDGKQERRKFEINYKNEPIKEM